MEQKGLPPGQVGVEVASGSEGVNVMFDDFTVKSL
jgi:hypothetical protein